MTVTTTTWHRLEPRVRGGDPAVGLQAALHDPLWLLGRQWQIGELLGEDAAFPVAVRIETEAHRLSRFRPGDAGRPVVDYDPAASPLEVTVEREPTEPPTPAAAARGLDVAQRVAARGEPRRPAAGAGHGAPAAAAARHDRRGRCQAPPARRCRPAGGGLRPGRQPTRGHRRARADGAADPCGCG
jgi:hypothetical protein